MFHKICTLGPIGYLPAPGTMATIATVPLMLLANIYLSPLAYALLCIAVFFLGIVCIKKNAHMFDLDDDPSCIVIDEVAGCLFTFACVPLHMNTVILGFVLFRCFDILKFGLVKQGEKLPGAWGIMADDLVAGLLANIVMQILLPILM